MAATAAAPLPPSVPETHPAVVTSARRAPLEIISRPTVPPGPGEILVHVEWTSSTPLDLHQADGGLLITHPHIMGSSYAGTVVQVGPELDTTSSSAPPSGGSSSTRRLQPGTKVFGFAYRPPDAKGHQTFATVPATFASILPHGLTQREAVSVPANLVSDFHALTHDLGLELPWPVPDVWKPTQAPILVWGAGGSVGAYALQILRHWRYSAVVAVAGAQHHARLRALGAARCFDYREADVVEKVLAAAADMAGASGGPRVPLILDCIGSLEGTLRPLSRIAEKGARVAIMLPVIVRDASATQEPAYEMDVGKCLVGEWAEGVELRGVRTHFYTEVSETLPSHRDLRFWVAMFRLESGRVIIADRPLVRGNRTSSSSTSCNLKLYLSCWSREPSNRIRCGSWRGRHCWNGPRRLWIYSVIERRAGISLCGGLLRTNGSRNSCQTCVSGVMLH